MAYLPPTRSELPEKKISVVLTPALKWLLEDAPNAEIAAADIAASTELRTEAHCALPILKAAALQLAGEAGVRDVIGRRFALYPQQDRSDHEWAAWWSDYYDALSNVTWAALEAAMKVYVANPASEFMPKPGKLLKLSQHTPNKAVKAFERATAAVLGAPKSEERVPYTPTEEEKAQVAAMLKSFKAKNLARVEAAKPPPMPAIHGKADETGLTPMMRELMNRREQSDNAS